MAKFDIKTATKPVYAGVGATDLAVERVREYVTGAQKRVTDLDLEPQALRTQATTVVNARVDAIAKDAKARRTAIEKRVAELQDEALGLPAKVQALVGDTTATVYGVYGELITRGESLVTRIRKQESTQATASSAKTTTAKAKTTKTQATKATKSTAKSTAKKATTTAKKKSAAPKSSAKATTTAAKKTATSATQAVADAAEKVGD